MRTVAMRVALVVGAVGCTGGFDAGETGGCTAEMAEPGQFEDVPLAGDRSPDAWDPEEARQSPSSPGERLANDCPPLGLSCHGACIDPLTDRSNCGGCGRRCGPLEACYGAACGPAEPEVVASGLPSSLPFSVGWRRLAWFDAPGLWTMPLDGGPIRELATEPEAVATFVHAGEQTVVLAASDESTAVVRWISASGDPLETTMPFDAPITGLDGAGDRVLVTTASPDTGDRVWWAEPHEEPREVVSSSAEISFARGFGPSILYATGAGPAEEGEVHLLDLESMDDRVIVSALRDPGLFWAPATGGFFFAWTPPGCDERDSPRELRRLDLATGETTTAFPIGCGTPISNSTRIFFPTSQGIEWRSFDGEASGTFAAGSGLDLLGATDAWLYALRHGDDGNELVRLPL